MARLTEFHHQQWVAGYNPWTGLVQTWPMSFRAPEAGVLGPRPPVQPQQAMTAQHQLQLQAQPLLLLSGTTLPYWPLFRTPSVPAAQRHPAPRTSSWTPGHLPTCPTLLVNSPTLSLLPSPRSSLSGTARGCMSHIQPRHPSPHAPPRFFRTIF
jgi:hypothetical protein